MRFDHPAARLSPYMYHQLTCPLYHLTTARHDALLFVVGAYLAKVGYNHPEYSRRACASDSVDGRCTDLVVRSASRHPPAVSCDASVVVTELLTAQKTDVRVPAAAKSDPRRLASSSIAAVARKKIDKHGPGCDARDLEFMAMIWSSHSDLGPHQTLKWLRDITRAQAALVIAQGGHRHQIELAFSDFLVDLQIAMARANHNSAVCLSRPSEAAAHASADLDPASPADPTGHQASNNNPTGDHADRASSTEEEGSSDAESVLLIDS